MGCVCGKNLADTTRQVMKAVFNIPLARQLNFAGGGEKTGIGAMAVTTVIIREYIPSEFYGANRFLNAVHSVTKTTQLPLYLQF